jgi:phage terminase large subunit GpA-like protein
MLDTCQLPDLNDTRDFAECWQAFQPPPAVRMLSWAEANVVTDLGRPYDRATYPHISAPGGPMDAFDDHLVRMIVLQWGVRLGKTFFGQCCCCKTAATNPAPMMFASPREKLGREQVQRLYEMVRKSPTLRTLLARHLRLQKQDLVEFTGCKMFVGWAKSASTLADKKAVVGHGTEIDKWEHSSTSTEGDPFDLFLDRFNDDYMFRKVIAEGTPTVKGKSRIERLRLLGWNASYYCPCPHCRRYQVIEFGGGEVQYGIKWDEAPDGRRNPELARRTARYVCRHCGAGIASEHRLWMMRRGAWAPEGCGVNDEVALAITEGRREYSWRGWKHAEWVTGAAVRDGETASYQLSTLCALQIPEWGDFAKKFLEALSKKQALRSMVNQWFAQTWEDAARKQTWEQLGQRLIVDAAPEIVPAGFSLITCGVDKQEDHYVFAVEAWNATLNSHTVAYGTAGSLQELDELIFSRRFACADGGTLRLSLSLLDTGYRPAAVYRFCRKRKRLLGCKGSSSPLDAYATRKRLGPNTTSPGQRIALVDTQSTQDWIDQQLYTLKPGDDGAATLFAGSLGEHQDFLEQLLNDAPVTDVDTSNNPRERWKRVDEHSPNDYRDCRRYAFAALMLATRGSKPRTRRAPRRAPGSGAPALPGPSGASPQRFPRVRLNPSR